MLTLSLIFLLLSIYLCYRTINLLFFHPLSSIPGPFLAKLTNVWKTYHYFTGRSTIDLELARRYGDYVRDGPHSVLVSNVEAFNAIYGFEHVVDKGDFYSCFREQGGFVHIFGQLGDVEHKVARKRLISTSMGPLHVSGFASGIDERVQAFIVQIEERLNKLTGEVVDFVPLLELLAFDTIVTILFGTSMSFVEAGYDQSGIIAARKEVLTLSWGIGYITWLAKLMATNPIQKRLQKPQFDAEGKLKGLGAFFAWTETLIASMINTESTGDVDDDDVVKPAPTSRLDINNSVLKSLLSVPTTDPRRMPLSLIKSELFDMFLAGVGSLAAALCTVLYELAAHPEWQGRVYNEVKGGGENIMHFETDADSDMNMPAGPGIRADGERESQVSALQIVIKEALRLHPPFAAPFERVIPIEAAASESCRAIPGLPQLPPGTRVWSSNLVMLRNVDVFGPDAETFRPNRWWTSYEQDGTPENCESERERLRRMEDLYCVFGRGSRRCIGETMSIMAIEKTVMEVLRWWEVGLEVEGQELKGWSGPDMHYLSLRLRLSPR